MNEKTMSPIVARRIAFALAATLSALGAACEEKSPASLAPQASALASAVPVTETSKKFVVQTDTSDVEFSMDAELEKIFGRAPKSVEGELFVDAGSIGKTRGLLKVDLLDLALFQRKRGKADEEFGEEVKEEKQNEDARTWLQINEDAPQEMREQNRWVEFKVEKVTSTSNDDVRAMSGSERKVTAAVEGTVRLHGRVAKKTAKLELSFHFDGDDVKSLSVKTTEPLEIGLEEHDIRPRKAFDQLADATLEKLGAKVAKIAKVNVEFEAAAQ
ncbi:MAG TPA: hypothetical protein VF989_16575 [Polyangiaceae bacterium]|jgi:hypothetical protein